MKISISAHHIRTGGVGGVEQVTHSLVSGFCSISQPVQLLRGKGVNLDQGFQSWFEQCGCGEVFTTRGGPNRFVAEQIACLDRRWSANVILFPNYHTPPLVPSRAGRSVTIIHDLQYCHYPKYFSGARRAWLGLAHRRTLHNAAQVIVISKNVQIDIARFYGEALSDRTTVIHNPIDWTRFEVKGRHPLDGRPYILSVAAQYPHKNLGVLVRSLRFIRQRVPGAKLVLAGQLSRVMGARFPGDDLRRLIAEDDLVDDVIITGHIPDSSLAVLLRHATVFAFPSVFEGFGMPPVEAMGLGVPVVTTKRAAIPEVTLGKAIYVCDPHDPHEWAARLIEILDSPYRLPEVTVQNIRHHYEPASIARKYISLFDGLI